MIFAPSRFLRRHPRFVAGLLAPPLLVAIGLSIDGWRDRIEPVDLLIVPGSTVRTDGTLSQNLHGRLLAALEYHRAGHSRWILVSGGTGIEMRDESLAMRDFLLANQVPDSVIIVDGNGVNTFETARFASRWMREHDAKTVGVASSFFHITRLRLALDRHGMPMQGHIHSRLYEPRDLYSVAREVPGLAAYLFKKP
ncbi:MAG: YdcF family protein [Fibrobacteres bacterium]|nr:YdcF family protein [Fibrobacterota bacterium]